MTGPDSLLPFSEAGMFVLKRITDSRLQMTPKLFKTTEVRGRNNKFVFRKCEFMNIFQNTP